MKTTSALTPGDIDSAHLAGRWLPVPGYEGFYEVSDRGQVRSLDRMAAHGSRSGGRAGTMALRGKILAFAPHRSGHVAVHLSRDGVVETVQVHRLVLEAFVGACPDGQETLHGLGGPADNRWPENIRYGTRSKNTIERHIYGGMHAKLTADAVRAMRVRRSQGETCAAIAADYGVTEQTAWRVVTGKSWRHVT